MSQPVLTPSHPTKTTRNDNWWLEPASIALGFTLFIIYATWRAFEFKYFEFNQYLSPFYSPKIILDFWKFSPAILVLWIPAGFRATCYYYRKAYYRAYFMDPPACGVGHGDSKYSGETAFPFILQNLHRYFFYLAALVVLWLWKDAFESIYWQGQFTFSILSLVMFVNVILLSNYTFGCHAYRHLVGGKLDCFSCTKATQTKHKVWKFVSKLNEHHMFWAWLSLFSVGFTDFYIRQVACHAFDPMRLF